MTAASQNQIASISGTSRVGWRDYHETVDYSQSDSVYPHEKNGTSDMVIRILLIDRDWVARSAVRARLEGRDDFEVVGEASSAEDALRKIGILRPNAIFLDIEMMESSGFAVERLLSQHGKLVVVFLAAHRNYALQAFDLGAADYVLKPIRSDRFEISLNRIREQLGHRRVAERQVRTETTALTHTSLHVRITVTDRKRTHIIEASEIEWIGAAGDYSELHICGATHLLREPLSVLLSRLPAHVFCRIHRSFVVNLSKVSGFKRLRNQDLLVKLKDRTVLRASRTFSDELKKAITQECAWRQPISSGQ